jgi:hypothetical protein
MTNIVYINLQTLFDLQNRPLVKKFLYDHKFVVYGYLARLHTIDEINKIINNTFAETIDCCISRVPIFKTADNSLPSLTNNEKLNKQLSMIQGMSLPLGFQIQWHMSLVLTAMYPENSFQYLIVYDNIDDFDDLLAYQTKQAIQFDKTILS